MQAEAQQQEIEETTSVELEDTSTEEVVEDSKEVELQEDEATRTNVQDNDEDELDQYSEGVQKRINKLTAARRKAEEEAAAAIQYIQQVQSENEDIKKRLKTID